MAVFRLLMRRCPDELPAGEIAQALKLKASTASVYLSALTHADMISQRRDGTRLLYRVNLVAAREMLADLFFDCCRGRADLCPPPYSELPGTTPVVIGKKFNVLFVCSRNSARSIFAETILRDIAGDRFTAYSAGTAHRSELNPFAVEMLVSNGHDVTPLRSKNVSEFRRADAPRMDFVFTVCDHAANEDCPTWPGQPVSGHWGIADPARVEGSDAEKSLVFQETYETLCNRVMAFASLPFEALDRAALQQCVDDIGKEIAIQDHCS